MTKSLAIAGVAAAVGLCVLLTACSSSGGGSSLSLADLATAPSSSAKPTPAVSTVTPPKIVAPSHLSVGKPVSSGRTETSFPPASTPTPTPTHSSSHAAPLPPLTSPVTFESYSYPKPSNCREAGDSYYHGPDVSTAIDVTVLSKSAALAKDLTIAAPNAQVRNMSNDSSLVSSSAVGDGVWRATYQTYVSLYHPAYAPVTISALSASADGSNYTITFASPVTVHLSDCHY
jgi:hypothetical protein